MSDFIKTAVTLDGQRKIRKSVKNNKRWLLIPILLLFIANVGLAVLATQYKPKEIRDYLVSIESPVDATTVTGLLFPDYGDYGYVVTSTQLLGDLTENQKITVHFINGKSVVRDEDARVLYVHPIMKFAVIALSVEVEERSYYIEYYGTLEDVMDRQVGETEIYQSFLEKPPFYYREAYEIVETTDDREIHYDKLPDYIYLGGPVLMENWEDNELIEERIFAIVESIDETSVNIVSIDEIYDIFNALP